MKKQGKPLNVCIVVASLDILGGQAVQAVRLLEGLRREANVRAEILPINPRLPGPFRLLQRIKYVRTVVTTAAYVALLLARLPRFDVVHIFSASYFSFLLAPTPALLVARLYGKPALLNYHSGEAEDHLRRWRRVVLPILRLAGRVVVPSAYLVEVFARFGVRATAIANTVDLSRFAFRPRRPLRPVLLSNRNLEAHYNVACTLRAFAEVKRRMPGARLIVAGDGSQRDALRAQVSAMRLSDVEFVGAVPPDRMPALYDRADVFVNASDVDNMPLSIIEAMACGLPVVTTDAGGIPHMVEHERTGLLARRGDAEGLARNVLRLFEEDGFAERLIAGAREECRRYTWEAVSGEWLAAYREMAGASGPGRAAAPAAARTEEA